MQHENRVPGAAKASFSPAAYNARSSGISKPAVQPLQKDLNNKQQPGRPTIESKMPIRSTKAATAGQPTAQLMPIILHYKGGYMARVESKSFTRERLTGMLEDKRLMSGSIADIRKALEAKEASDDLLKLTKNDSMGIFDLATQLIKTRPPDEYAYVALGNSPAPIMHMVREITEGKVVILPLPMSDVSTGAAEKVRTDEMARANLFKYLDQYVAPSFLQGKSKVAVVDIAAGGKALRTGLYYLTIYYQSKGREIEVAMQALNEVPLAKGEELEGTSEGSITKEIPVLPPVSKEQQDTQTKLVGKAYNKRYSLKEWEPASLPEILSGELKSGKKDEWSTSYSKEEISEAYKRIKNEKGRQEPVSRVVKEIKPSDVEIGKTVTETSGNLKKLYAINLPEDPKAGDEFMADGTKWKINTVTPPEGTTLRVFIRMHTKYTLTRLE